MGTGSVRYLSNPRRCTVTVDGNGLPLTVVDGRTRSVDEIREDWLVEDRWWTGAPVSRHYFEVILDGGRVGLVYREGGIWMIH